MKTKRMISVILIMLLAVTMASLALAAEDQVSERIRDCQSDNIYLSQDEFPLMIRERNFYNEPITIDLSTFPYVLGNGYVEFEIPIEELFAEIVPFQSSPLVGNAGMMNAFFPPYVTFAVSNLVVFDWRINSIPWNAVVTNVTLSSQRTAVEGVSYTVGIHRLFSGTWTNGVIGTIDIPWAPTVSTNGFNDDDPWGQWAIDFFATRIIPPPHPIFPIPDPGAGATIRNAQLRVFFST